MKCEMCGKEASLRKTKVEGAVLKLCKECQQTGKVMGSSGKSSSSSGKSSGGRKSRKKRRKPREQQKHLVRDFDDRVKQTRESKDITIEDLADKMKVKESVVHRIESGKLKPDEKLSKKIKKFLGIDLYRQESELDYESETTSKKTSKNTIGDIAKVKKK